MAPHAVTVEDYSPDSNNQSQLDSQHVMEIPSSDLSSGRYFPAAVVGHSCRLPGGVSHPEHLWELCTRSRSGWSAIPKERFNLESYEHPDPSKLGSTNATGGYFLKDDPWVFDAPFFNITTAEAKAMDPQQRILLELTFEALESAGLPKESLRGKKVGVFMACAFNDYDAHCLRDTDTVPMYSATGYNPCMLANRISYYFDFRGPSYSSDTACSSSLTSLYGAMNAMRNGDCDYAIVGGANLNITPDRFIDMSLSQLFNDEGKCYAFDHRAVGGYARGEGTGVIVLRPLASARANNDYVRCAVVNASLNQDGRTNGITAPNGDAQYDLIKETYERAGILPSDCGFVEMHGTGTKKGDPIEAQAVARAFAKGRNHENPLYIGSIKANVGHLEGVSGMASLIKSSMMLDQKLILPNVNWEKANPEIPMEDLNIKVPTETMLWPNGKKYISINSFGFGGANAHAILERVPAVHRKGFYHESIKWRLFTLTANDEEALKANASNLLVYFDEHPEVFDRHQSRNLAYTFGQRRSHLAYKLSMPFSSIENLHDQLSRAKKGTRSTKQPRIGWIFTGQGAQWPAMGRELIDVYPVFRDSIMASDKLLKQLGADFSLFEQLHGVSEADSVVNEAFFSQPGCVALQVALVNLLHSWGVYPTDVAGHSSGEISAAYAAGIITAEDAVALGFYRGEGAQLLKKKHPEIKGGMIAVGCSRKDIQPVLDSLQEGYATIACVNSPGSVTVSGEMVALDALQKILDEKGMFNRKLMVDIAYHSKHLELVAPEYLDAIANIKPCRETRARMHSSLHGRLVKPEEIHANYWSENLTHAVEFTSAVQSLASLDASGKSVDFLVEVGPHSALKGPCQEILKTVGPHGSKIGYETVISRGKDACETAVNCAAKLVMKGAILDHAKINVPDPDVQMPKLLNTLPNYAWNHSTQYRHHWRIQEQHLYKTGPRHDIIGTTADWSNGLEPTWRNIIHLDSLPWLRDHKMQGLIVFPLAGYLAMAVESAQQRAIKRGVEFDKFDIREVTVSRALVLEEATDVEVNISLRPHNEGTRTWSDQWDEFRVTSWTQDQGWTEHCRGLVAVRNLKAQNDVVKDRVAEADDARLKALVGRVQKDSTTFVDSKKMYDQLAALGVEYGPTFRGLEDVRVCDDANIQTAVVQDTASGMPKGYESPYLIHPSWMDMLIHSAFSLIGAGRSNMSTLYLPASVGRVEIARSIPLKIGEGVRAICTGTPNHERQQPISFDITALSNQKPGNPVVSIFDLTFKPADSGESIYANDMSSVCFKMDWTSLQSLEAASATESKEETEAQDTSKKTIDSDVVIVYAINSQAQFAADLAKALQDVFGIKVSNGLISEVDTTEKICIFAAELVQPILKDCSAKNFQKVQKILSKSNGVLWLTSGATGQCTNPDASLIVGLARSIRLERAVPIVTLDLDPCKTANISHVVSVFEKVWAQGVSDMEFMERNGELSVPRVTKDVERDIFVHRETQNAAPYNQPFFQEGRRLKLIFETPGSLNTLHFDDEIVGPLPDNDVEIKVEATGINFKDIVVSMGQFSQPYLGIECSGTISSVGKKVTSVKPGDPVMAFPHGAYANYTRCAATSVTKFAKNMSFETAATIPVVFCTAYHGLINLARLEKGEKVLIHAAAGGVGQAAIQLAQMVEAEIFATVGSQGKKDILTKKYGIPDDHIFYSRDVTFGPAIRSATNGVGVDVVINSLAGDMLRETWDCLAPFGRFIEIGKRDITGNTRLEMAKFEHNATFSSVDLSKIADHRPELMSKLLLAVNDLFEKGTLKPITPVTIMSITDVEQAFRILQSGKNHGKLVITAASDAQVKATCPKKTEQIFKTEASYLLVGGTGGLGQVITKRMASGGAKHIVLSSRSGKITPQLEQLIAELKKIGTSVYVYACDVGEPEAVEKLFKTELKTLPPLRGVVHAPMVLKDVLFERMSHDDYDSVVRAKVNGAWNLHRTLGSTPLDFFLMFSSISTITGTRGQAAYAAANNFLDQFTRYRQGQGLCATVINLSAVEDVGHLKDEAWTKEVRRTLATEFISEDEMVAIFHAAVTGKIDATISHQSISGLHIRPGTIESLPWTTDAKFAYLVEAAQDNLPGDSTEATASTSQLLRKATSDEQRIEAIMNGLVKKLSDVLSIPVDEINPSEAMEHYGLDSLVAIEIRNWISRETEANVQVLELLRATSLIELCKKILSKSKIVN